MGKTIIVRGIAERKATDDPDVFKRRRRQQRNFFATLMLSQGVPMLTEETNSPARKAGTTTPIARITKYPGWIGNMWTKN